jgi:hypothetical protein
MTIIDRRWSVAEGQAVKAPCRAATTANITLSGQQTIDGVAVVENDRVLVKNQSTASENGIYTVSTGPWKRTRDFDGAYDAVTGTRVYVTEGTLSANIEYCISTTGDIVIDRTAINWTSSGLQAVTSAAAAAASAVAAQTAETNAEAAAAEAMAAAAALSGFRNYETRALVAVATIPGTVTKVTINGYSASGDGGAGTYIRLASPPSPVKAWHLQSADGAWWRLDALQSVLPRQLGAKLDGSTDDTAAIQAWHDYGVAFGVACVGQAGTAVIPTGTITLLSGAYIDGRNQLTLKRTTDTVASVMRADSQSNILVKDLAFTTTAGFGSASSNTIGLTTQNYTVPAGKVGLVVNNFVQIASVTDPTKYMIARINSYVGTTLNVTGTTAVGSGTFNNWYIDVYPLNGDYAESNIALRFTTCTDVVAEGCTVTGRFYNGIDCRDCSDIIFEKSIVTGVVNRAIHMGAYGALSKANQCLNNVVEGNSFTQYGINTSGTDTGILQSLVVAGNNVNFCNFQGIEAGGKAQWCTIADNNVILTVGATAALGILVQFVTPQVPQRVAITGNTVEGGFVGVNVIDALYVNVSNNRVTSSTYGFLVSASSGSCADSTFSGNGADNCVSHGFSFTSASAGANTAHTLTGNSAISNGGWGFIFDGNTSNFAYVGNLALSNTAGQYSAGGTGHVSTGNK